VFVPKNEDIVIRNTILVDVSNTTLTTGDVPVYQNATRVDFSALTTVPPKADIEIRAKSTNDAVRVTVNIEGILADAAGMSLMMG